MEALNPSSPYDAFAVERPRQTDIVYFPGEAVVEKVHAEHPEIEARGYQIDCLGKLVEVRREGGDRALIHMATGLGKTTVAAMDVKQFIDTNPGSRVLFVAHQNEILKQARERFHHILGGDRSYGMFTGENRRRKDTEADCVFASFQLLHTSRDSFAPDDFDYIIVDESHHGKATTYEPSLDYFTPSFMLGMTATPDRRDLKEIREIFGNEVYSKPLDEALSERLLARPDYHVILDNIPEVIPDDYRRLNRTLFIPKRDEDIAEIIARRLKDIEHPKVIAFCPSIEHANRMAALLPNAAALHSQRPKQERRAVMNSFINNGLTAITTVDLFNEGIDVADANVVVFLRSTESEIIFQQQLGRGLRKTPGKESVQVLDFVASYDRLMMIDKVLGEHVENDDATITFDEVDENNETVYEIDFTATSMQDEIDVNRSDFQESIRRIMEILRSIDRSAGTLSVAPEGWIALRSLVAERSRTKERHRLAGCARALGVTAVRYVADDGYPRLHIPVEEAPAVIEKYNQLLAKVDWNEFTNERIIELALSIKPDGALTYPEIDALSKEGGFPSSPTIKKRFESVAQFAEACGFKQADWDSVSDEDLVAMALALSPDAPLSQRALKELRKTSPESFPPATYLDKRFESLGKFQKLCGFAVKKVGIKAEEIVKLAKAISPDRPLTTAEIDKLSKEKRLPSLPTIVDRFGSLDTFQEACGFEKRWFKASDEELVAQALRLSPDSPLTTTAINELVKEGKFVGQNTIIKRFGSMQQFQEACGFNAAKQDWGDFSDEDLIALADKLSPGRRLGVVAMDALDTGQFPSSATIVKRFGSMQKWHEARGL